jgi:hypothetical protein
MTQAVDTLTGDEGTLRRGQEVCIALPGSSGESLEARVLKQFRLLKLPALSVRSTPAPRTFVNLPTTFAVTPPRKTYDLGPIQGRQVTVVIRPVSYRWSFGDGSVRTTSAHGGRAPEASVTHAFTRPATASVSVRTTYRARYRVDGGRPREIPGEVPVEGPVTTLPVEQARVELIGGPR